MINNRYELKRLLGVGRSKVFLCFDSRTNTNKAIKILSKDASPDEIKMFIEEYFLLKNLNHPSIIKVFEKGTISKLDSNPIGSELQVGDIFFTLEFAQGTSLDNFVGKLNESQLFELIKQISSILLYLHSSCFVYFDLKFENIFIDSDDGKIQVKFIDFGFTRRLRYGTVLENTLGSIQYMAPEIIRKGKVDFRSDLYSLGIILYKLIYSKFPFEGETELDIVKEHVEGNFLFPQSGYPDIVLEAVNKLISKNPSDRFQNILELLDYLNIKLDKYSLQNFLPIPSLIGRDRQLSIIDSWLNDESSTGLINIKGSSSSGKTFFLNYIENKNPNAFFISMHYASSDNFHLHFLEDLLMSNPVLFDGTSTGNKILTSISNGEQLSFEEIKTSLIEIISDRKPLLIFDDFNLYPPIQKESFTNLFPVFQISGAKIIISQNSDSIEIDDSLKNQNTIHLNTFTEEDIQSFCEKTFNSFLPKAQLQNIYIKYSDKLPSNLIELQRELYLLEILFVEKGSFKITDDEEVLKQLDLSQTKLHDLKIINLTQFEKAFVQIVASVGKEISEQVAAKILGIEEAEADKIVLKLKGLNIFSYLSSKDSLKFSSQSIKQYIYNGIEDKKSLHLAIAKTLLLNPGWNDIIEIAEQFEKAEDIENAFRFYINEIDKLENVSAYNNVKEILSHLKTLNLDADKKYIVDKKLCKTYKNIGDHSGCLNLLEVMYSDFPQSKNDLDLSEVRGLCLMNTGLAEEGKKIFMDLLHLIANDEKQNTLNFQIASIELELNNYDEAKKICNKIISNPISSSEIKGRALNLVALTEILGNNNLNEAQKYFEKALHCYTKDGIAHLISRVEVNLGNISNIKGEYDAAEKHWDDALKLNSSIGNLDQQAFLFMNYGIYKFDKLHFEEAISFYINANRIFETLGNKKGVGLTLYNLAEVYFEICSYEKAINNLKGAAQIFNEINNTEELVAVMISQALFYFEFDDKNSFENLFKKFYDILKQKSLTNKFVNEIEYMNFLRKIIKKGKINKKKIEDIIEQFENTGQSSVAARILFHLTGYLLAQKSFDEAFDLLLNEKYEKLIDKNLYWKAEKLYYLGLINSKKKKRNTQQILDYYMEALRLIENEYITALTWKVILEICSYFAYRGIIHKAQKYLKYLKEIFNYIIDQFVDVELKWLFESSSTIKRVYARIHSITNLIYK